MYTFTLEVKIASVKIEFTAVNPSKLKQFYYSYNTVDECPHEGCHYQVIPIQGNGWKTVVVDFTITDVCTVHYSNYIQNFYINGQRHVNSKQLDLASSLLPPPSWKMHLEQPKIYNPALPRLKSLPSPPTSNCLCQFMPSPRKIHDLFFCNQAYAFDADDCYEDGCQPYIFQWELPFAPKVGRDYVLLETNRLNQILSMRSHHGHLF